MHAYLATQCSMEESFQYGIKELSQASIQARVDQDASAHALLGGWHEQ